MIGRYWNFLRIWTLSFGFSRSFLKEPDTGFWIWFFGLLDSVFLGFWLGFSGILDVVVQLISDTKLSPRTILCNRKISRFFNMNFTKPCVNMRLPLSYNSEKGVSVNTILNRNTHKIVSGFRAEIRLSSAQCVSATT